MLKYRRRLPHIHVPGCAYFLTFRLSPQQATPLNPEERDAVRAHVCQMAPGLPRAFVIMPDHVHLVYQSRESEDLRKTLKALKGSSSRALVARFGRRPPVWQDETYDHLLREEKELLETWKYIENNPVRSGLAKTPDEYRWSSAWMGA